MVIGYHCNVYLKPRKMVTRSLLRLVLSRSINLLVDVGEVASDGQPEPLENCGGRAARTVVSWVKLYLAARCLAYKNMPTLRWYCRYFGYLLLEIGSVRRTVLPIRMHDIPIEDNQV